MDLPSRRLKSINSRAIFGCLDWHRSQTTNAFIPLLAVEFQFVHVCWYGFVPKQTDLSIFLHTMNLGKENFRGIHSAGVFYTSHKISRLELTRPDWLCGHDSLFLASLCKVPGQVDSKPLSLIASTSVISLLCLSGWMSQCGSQRGFKRVGTVAMRNKQRNKQLFFRQESTVKKIRQHAKVLIFCQSQREDLIQ